MAVGSGIASQLMVGAETTFGTYTPPTRSWEFRSETLELKKTTVQGQGLHAGGYYDRGKRRVLTNYDVNGGVTMDLPESGLGLLLEHMVGSFGQALVGPVAVTGSAGAFKEIHNGSLFGTSGLSGKSLVLQKGVPAVDGTVLPFSYVGCKVTDWTISVQTGQIAELQLTFDGRNELAGTGNGDPLNGSVPSLVTFTNPTFRLFHFREATLYTTSATTPVTGTIGADPGFSLASPVAVGNVKSASVKHSVKLDMNRYFIGSNGFKSEQLEDGFRKISGEFDIEWLSSEAMYNAFSGDTNVALELKFVGSQIGATASNNTLDILLPQVKLDGEAPKVSGPAVVTQKVAFTGLDDETTTPIQITRISADTTL